MVIGGGRFNNPALTPNISTLTDVQHSDAALGLVPTRCVKNFWGLGLVKPRPQGAHLHRLHNVQLEAWGLWSVSGHLQQVCFLSELLGSQLWSGISGLQGSQGQEGHEDFFCFVIVIAVNFHHGYSWLTCTSMDEKNSWILSRNWIQCLLASLVQTPNYIQY